MPRPTSKRASFGSPLTNMRPPSPWRPDARPRLVDLDGDSAPFLDDAAEQSAALLVGHRVPVVHKRSQAASTQKQTGSAGRSTRPPSHEPKKPSGSYAARRDDRL